MLFVIDGVHAANDLLRPRFEISAFLGSSDRFRPKGTKTLIIPPNGLQLAARFQFNSASEDAGIRDETRCRYR